MFNVSIPGLFRSVWGLLCNPAYSALCVSAVFEALMNGTFILFPKYYEEQFGITTAKANIVIGKSKSHYSLGLQFSIRVLPV